MQCMTTCTTLLSRSASVAGARHRAAARNCQDAALTWVACDQAWGIAVVCDGCGSQPHSELGALWGRQAWCRAVQRTIASGHGLASPSFWTTVCDDVVTALTCLAAQCGGDDERERAVFVQQHLLFTSVIGVVHEATVSVLALGDGAALVNDEPHVFGPWADNAPPYIAYALLDSTFAPMTVATIVTRAKAEVGRLAVASDGIDDFVGGLRALLSERAVCNLDGLRRALEVAARPTERIDWAEQRVQRIPGCLPDDAAVALLQWAPLPSTAAV